MKYAAFLVFLVICRHSSCQEYEIFRSGDLYGFTSGRKTVIPAQFQYASHFRQGLALVQQHNKWGYIDPKGNWKIEPVFDKAQGYMEDSTALVMIAGKFGLIDLNGDYILKPEYTDFKENYHGMQLFNRTKTGYLVAGWETPIPAAYLSVDLLGHFVMAKRSETSYDLYADGKLLLSGIDRPSGYFDLNYDAEKQLLIVHNAGKAALINETGELVFPFEYASITLMKGYRDEQWTELPVFYKLDKSDYFYDEAGTPDVIGSNVFYLVNADGKLISEAPFENLGTIQLSDGESTMLELRVNGKIAYLNQDMTVRYTPYTSILRHRQFLLCNDGERVHIINPQGKEIGLYDDARVFSTETYTAYDENGDLVTTAEPAISELYVRIVKRGEAGTEQTAIFDLIDEKQITPWADDFIRCSFYYPQDDDYHLVVLSSGDRMAYYYTGMAAASGFDYSDIAAFNSGSWAEFGYMIKAGEEKETLFRIGGDELKKDVTATAVGLSTLISVDKIYPTNDPDYPGGTYTQTEYPFRSTFGWFRNEEYEYGILTSGGTVLDLKVDSLTQNPGSDYVIAYRKSGKWGFVNVYSGEYSPAVFDQTYVFTYNKTFGDVLTMDEAVAFYMDIKGRKFYTVNPELKLFKEKGKAGYKAWPDFDLESKEQIVVIPAVYKELKVSELCDRTILARGTNGLWGMINYFNDTIVPFLYTDLEEVSFDGYQFFYASTIGKKKGLLNCEEAAIPAVYDKLTYNYLTSGFIVENDGNYGFYNYRFDELLKTVYDGLLITDRPIDPETNRFGSICYCVLKDGKWYYSEQFPNDSALLSSSGYDLIINGNGFIRTAGGYDNYHLISGLLVEKDAAIPISKALPSYPVRFEDGKLIFTSSKGKTLFKQGFTCVFTDPLDKNRFVAFDAISGSAQYFSIDTATKTSADGW